MKRPILRIIFSLLGAVLLTYRAHATTVIDFNEFTNVFGMFSGPFDSKGFHFDNSAAGIGTSPFVFWGADNPWNADPGGATLSHNLASTTTILTRIGGGPFDFDAVDFGNVYNKAGNPEDVTLTGTLEGGGTVSTMVTTDGLAGLTHFHFGSLFADVVQITWTPSNGAQNNFLQIDNVVVNVAPSAVPEPSSNTVLLSAMAVLAGAAGTRTRARPADDWRTRRDSNARPSPSEGDALSN